jgi:hypothetical protein
MTAIYTFGPFRLDVAAGILFRGAEPVALGRRAVALGWLLMKHMIESSRHKDLKSVRGQVLSESTTMLAMCTELGFHIADDPDDPGVKTVALPVRAADTI